MSDLLGDQTILIIFWQLQRKKLKEEETRDAFLGDIERDAGNIPAVIGGRDVNED